MSLVVFDVDGTLYDQRRLRLRMAGMILRHCLAGGDLATPRILAAYRRRREDHADRRAADFETMIFRELAGQYHRSEPEVRAIVREWLHHRPLPLLDACRYRGVRELFAALRASGRRIGVLSDHPARAKLDALGLEADWIVGAGDAGAETLKPDPRGLLHILALAGVGREAAIMIGDRADRDGETGRRAGVKTYLRSARSVPGGRTFTDFLDILPAPDGRAA